MNISKGELKKLEIPLLELDEVLQNFSKLHKMKFTKNYHGWPERSLEWEKNKLHKLIQIWLENDSTNTFNFWICASQDKLGKRYWKNMYLKQKTPFLDIKNSLGNLLNKGFEILESWESESLEIVSDDIIDNR